MTTVSLASARYHWARAQGLAAPLGGTADDVVTRSGWLRTPETAISLLAFEDSFLVTHGGPSAVADPEHHDLHVQPWGPTEKSISLRDARHLATRTIVVGGRLAGTWKIDLARSELVTSLFSPLSQVARAALDDAAHAMVAFFRDELGHGRSFSLDTDARVEARAAALRSSDGGGRAKAKPAKAKPANGKARAKKRRA